MGSYIAQLPKEIALQLLAEILYSGTKIFTDICVPGRRDSLTSGWVRNAWRDLKIEEAKKNAESNPVLSRKVYHDFTFTHSLNKENDEYDHFANCFEAKYPLILDVDEIKTLGIKKLVLKFFFFHKSFDYLRIHHLNYVVFHIFQKRSESLGPFKELEILEINFNRKDSKSYSYDHKVGRDIRAIIDVAPQNLKIFRIIGIQNIRNHHIDMANLLQYSHSYGTQIDVFELYISTDWDMFPTVLDNIKIFSVSYSRGVNILKILAIVKKKKLRMPRLSIDCEEHEVTAKMLNRLFDIVKEIVLKKERRETIDKLKEKLNGTFYIEKINETTHLLTLTKRSVMSNVRKIGHKS